MPPLVSVVIPAYNGARFLPETLNAVLAQEGVAVEVVVVDDASTDETPAVLRAYGDRVRSLRLDRNAGGPAIPRNEGFRAARGGYIALFDADDLMVPGKLREEVDFLERHPDIPFVFTDFNNLHPDGREEGFLADHGDFQRMPKAPLGNGWWRIKSGDAFETLIDDNFIGTSGVLFRRSLLDEVGPMDASLVNSDDVDFFFRVARRSDLGFIAKPLHKRRLHAANISSRGKALHERLKVRRKLLSAPMTPAASRALNRSMSRILFAIGYAERLKGERLSAVRHYWESWLRDRAQWRVFKSMLRALLPF